MVGTEIASLFATVGADVTDFNKGMKGVKDDLSLAEKGMGGLQSAVGAGLKAAAGIGITAVAGLTTGIGYAVTKAADMEQGIQNIAASMQLGSEETAQLKDLIMDLGLDPNLKVTATEAAQAIEVLGTAGLTMDEILQGAARSTVLLANSTGADFAQAGGIASDVMAQFNITAADMAMAVDQITGVTVASKFTIDDYGLALAQAGGVAGSVGVDFEDFNAVIAATSPSFASGSDAGTSFKTFLQRLVPTTSDAKEALIQLGLSTGEDVVTAFFDAQGAMRPMEEISENLQNAFSGLSEAQKIEAASTIFGTDAMRTALALAEGGGEIIAEMKKIIGNTSAEESAATRMDSLRGSWEIMTGVAETLTLGIGDKFIPVVRKAIDWVASLAQKHGPPLIDMLGSLATKVEIATDWLLEAANTGKLLNDKFAALPKPIQDVVSTTIEFTDTVKAAVEWVKNVIGQFIDWKDILAAVSVVIASIVIPAIGAFLTAVSPAIALFAGLVVASALLRKGWEEDWLGIRSTITYAWGIISGVFREVWTRVGEIVSRFQEQWAILTDTNATLGDKLELVWNTIKDVAGAVWQGIVDVVTTLLPPFVAKLQEWGAAAWDWLAEAIPIALTKIGEWGTALGDWLTNNLPTWVNTLASWATAAWDWLVGATTEATGKLGEWGAALWDWLSTNLPTWLGALGTWATAAWQWLVGATSSAVTKLGEWGGALFGWLADNLPSFVATILGWATALVQWITDVIPTAINNLAEFVKGLREEGDGNGLSSFVAMAVGWAKALWEWITKDLIPAVGPAWLEFMGAMGNYGVQLLGALGNLALELGKTLWQWIVDVTPTAVTKLGEWGAALWGWISDNMPTWVSNLAKWASEAWQWIADASQPALRELGAWGAALWDWVKDNAPSWAAELAVWAAHAWEWIRDVAIPEATAQLGEWGAALWDWIKDNAPSWKEKLGEWAEAAWKWIEDVAIPEAKKKVQEWGESLWNWVKDNISSWKDKIGEWAKAAVDWLVTAKDDALTKLDEWGTALIGWVTTSVRDWITKFKDAGNDIVQGLWDGISSKWTGLTNWFSGIWGDLTDRFKRFFGIASPSTLFMGFGQDMTTGLQMGISNGTSDVRAAFDHLGSTIDTSIGSIVTTVGTHLNSTMQSVVEGVRYGAGLVNLATADVLYQSEEAERQARAKWEKLRDEMAKPLPPVTAPPVIPPSDVNNPNPPSIPPIILPPVIVPPPPPPPQPFNQKNLTDALKDVLGTQDITMPFLNLRDFADLMASTVDNAILSGKIAPSQLTAEQDIARVRAADAQDYQIAKVLDALQVLINLITTKGLGSNLNFDITSAPGDIADNRTELSVLIEYLTAIYAT